MFINTNKSLNFYNFNTFRFSKNSQGLNYQTKIPLHKQQQDTQGIQFVSHDMKIFQEIYRNIKHKHFLEKVNPFLACLVDEFQKFLRWLRHYCSLRFHIPQRLKLYKNKHYRVQRKKRPPSLSNLLLFRQFSQPFLNFGNHCILPFYTNKLAFDLFCQKFEKLRRKTI